MKKIKMMKKIMTPLKNQKKNQEIKIQMNQKVQNKKIGKRKNIKNQRRQISSHQIQIQKKIKSKKQKN